MKVLAFKQICKNPILHKKIPPAQTKIKSKEYVESLFDVPQDEKEALFRIFLENLYDARPSAYAERLFSAFSRQFRKLSEKEQRSFSDPFHKIVQKVSGVYAKRKITCDSVFEAAAFSGKEFEEILQKAQEKDFRLMRKQEEVVTKCAIKNPNILPGIEEFQRLNDSDYPHSVVQLDHSPKMVIIGTPRTDREDTVRRFYSTMMHEDVEVIVALNTASDWKGAIAYYEEEHLNALKNRFKITCEKVEVLYEGKIAANFPKDFEIAEEDLRSKRYKEYRPRIIERAFVIKDRKTNEKKKIIQLHYENWPDRDAAPDLEGWWMLLRRQLELSPKSLAIHCQGGIGRTNVHAILTTLVSEMDFLKDTGADLNDASFNVPLTMYRLKEQAPRLGGAVCAKRFYQIYEMAYRYFKLLQE